GSIGDKNLAGDHADLFRADDHYGRSVAVFNLLIARSIRAPDILCFCHRTLQHRFEEPEQYQQQRRSAPGVSIFLLLAAEPDDLQRDHTDGPWNDARRAVDRSRRGIRDRLQRRLAGRRVIDFQPEELQMKKNLLLMMTIVIALIVAVLLVRAI